MKKILSSLIVVAALTLSVQSHAQIAKTYSVKGQNYVKDTLGTGADTATVTLSFDGSFKSLELDGTKISGTAGGKVYFQGQLPSGGTWENLDSLTVGNTAGLQYTLVSIPSPRLHKAYRVIIYNSGGDVKYAVTAVRYTGGAILRSDPNRGLAYNLYYKNEQILFIDPQKKIRS